MSHRQIILDYGSTPTNSLALGEISREERVSACLPIQ